MTKAFLLVLFLFIGTITQAQLYTVKGRVTGISIEPVPFAVVNVKDHVYNAVTNETGEFKLQVPNGRYTFIFTCLGYETYKQDVIVKNEDVSLNIILVENTFLLNEVAVDSKYKDPSRRVVQETIKNKGKYVQANYQCDLYVKDVEMDNKYVSRKDSLKMVKKQHNDSLRQATPQTDTLHKDSLTRYSDSVKVAKKHKLFALDSIHWFRKTPTRVDSVKLAEQKKKAKSDSINAVREQIIADNRLNMAEIVINKSFEYPDKLKEDRIAYETWGDISGLFYMSTSEGEFNFYQNAVYCPSVSQMPIQSPISTSGLVMYKYKLLDVFMDKGLKIYRIKVEPNLFGNSLVTGEMEIIDSLFCLRSFKFNFPKYQLSEYTSFTMEANYTPHDDSLYRINKMAFDYKMGGKKGSHGRTVVYYENFKYEKSFGKKYFKNEVSTTLEEAYNKDSTFWKTVRKEPLSERELRFIRTEDSIRSVLESKPYLDSIDSIENHVSLFKIAFIGQSHYNREQDLRYYFNPLWTSYQPIGVGGTRISYGFGVQKKFKNKKTITGYLNPNYGIRNKDLNGTVSVGGLYNPYKNSYWNVNAGRHFDIVNASNTWTAVFRTSNYYLSEAVDASHKTELFNGFYWGIHGEYSVRKSISNFQNDTLTNLFFDNSTAKPIAFGDYNALYITNDISYTPQQKYIREPYEKIVLGSKYPTFTVTYRRGIPTVFNSSIDFDYLEYSITKDIDFRFFGISKIRFYTGKFYNIKSIRQIDYKYQPIVGFPFFGNPLSSFQALEKSYITLNRFYAGHYFHRFNGAFINKIPYMKYLKLTESAGGGFLYSKENNLVYFEAYAGIEKNFRIFKQMFRIGLYFVEGKTNNYPFRSGIRISIDVYDRFNNKWTY